MRELDSITVKGFKSLASIEGLELGPINVLVGANGAGKSNFIEVFSFLHAIRAGHLQEYTARAGGADQLLHFGSKTTKQMQLGISFREAQNRYEIKLIPTDTDELYPQSETVWFWDKARYSHPVGDPLSARGKEAGISDPDAQRISGYVRRHLDRWRVYHFHDTSSTSPMKKTASVDDNRALRPDGSNLAPFLYYLRERHTSAYGLIRRVVQRVAPFFDDFDLEPQQINEDKIRLEWKHTGSDSHFPAASLSDGSLRFIALATLLLQPESHRPSVILIDEPELGLHPYAITLLAALVKQASATNQIILSTQSPFLLDHFQPEDVLVADRVDDGTKLTRLESDRLAAWLEDYSLGQLWEKNELGGRPGAH